MRKMNIAIALAILLPVLAHATQNNAVYRWVDEDGILHYGDSVPAEYAELEKQIINDAGIIVAVLRGKKTEEEIAEELRLAQIADEKEKQRRDDSALLATYQNIDEIVMHRDRRIELFQDQARLTERNEHHLCDALARLDNIGRAAAIPARDENLALIIRINQARQVAEHQTMPVTQTGAWQ